MELEESQRSKASKGPSARPHPAGGVPKPPPDPPPDDVEGKEKSQQQRAMSGHAARMDSYALATFADLQVSEAHREVSKSAVGSTGMSKKSFKFFRKVQKKVAEVMNSQLSTSFWTMLILTNSVYLGIHVEITAVNPRVSHIPAFFYIHFGFAAIFTVEVVECRTCKIPNPTAVSVWRAPCYFHAVCQCLTVYHIHTCARTHLET